MAKLRVDLTTEEIPDDYDDDYLELVRLLTEAAGLEHSLMVAYLFALFSIPDDFAAVRGDVTARSFRVHSPTGPNADEGAHTLLEVALEEMQHLSQVNWFLAELGAAPNFTPHVFPFTSDLYPFDIEMRPLGRTVAATYLWIEADAGKLKRDNGGTGESNAFIDWVYLALSRSPSFRPDLAARSHLGTIYKRIIEQVYEVERDPPAFLGEAFDWNRWKDEMNRIAYQGEESHYQFFRSLFTGEAFAQPPAPPDVMPDLPTRPIVHRTAYTGQANSIPPGPAQRLAWLANLHYWIILSLLDVSYRSNSRHLSYRAMNHMTMALWHLGRHLAKQNVGLPFDPMGPQYVLGRSDRLTIEILKRLVLEAKSKAQGLAGAGLLPAEYDVKVFDMTLANIGALVTTGVQPDGTEFRFG